MLSLGFILLLFIKPILTRHMSVTKEDESHVYQNGPVLPWQQDTERR